MKRSSSRWARAVMWASLVSLGASATALAGGGPRNVLVVVNENAAESLEIGNYYVRSRGIPADNICRLQTSSNLTVDKATYQNEIETPIQACIAASPYRDRLDYIVLTRGLPIRASFPGGVVSTTALLQVMDTPLKGKDQESNFWDYENPYLDQDQYFAHSKTFGGYHLYAGTMLSGYWSHDALALVDRSLASDGNPPTTGGGTFYLEDAAGAAGVRNDDFPAAVANLRALGFNAEHIVLSADVPSGSIVASHVTGGSYSGNWKSQIESWVFPPGSIVDALESYGLVPENFMPDAGPWQSPVTWWITAGATGGQGTVAEPYNVAFPDAFMLEPYVSGYNMGETFAQGIPYLYWMNLVLGDPLAQPFAVLPRVTVASPLPASTVSGNVQLNASATTPKPAGIDLLEFFIDDTLVASFTSASGLNTWDSTTVADGPHRFDVVAYERSKTFTQSTGSVEFNVNNHALSAAITAPAPATQVSGSFNATVTASAGVTTVSIEVEGLTVGTAAGSSPFTVPVDTARLGRGLNALVAVGTAGALTVRSAPVDVYVVKPPAILQVNPRWGATAGGYNREVQGWNFEGTVRVFFGANESPSVTILTENRLQVQVPAGSLGAVDVRVDGIMGLSATKPGAFRYITTPTLTSATPDFGPETGGTRVTLVGTDFEPEIQVYFGPTQAASVNYIDRAHVEAVTPAEPPGRVDVRVDNPTGLSATLPAAFEFLALPTVTSVTPPAGLITGGTPVTVQGTLFDPAMRVFFGANEATPVTWLDAAHVQTVTPPGAVYGNVDVRVENPRNLTATLPNGFRYIAAPVIDSLAPAEGPTAGNTQVTINGSAFETSIRAFFGAVESPRVIVFDDKRVIAYTPPGTPGFVDVRVENQPGLEFTAANAFRYVATPTVLSATPNQGPAAGGTVVRIAGSDFDPAAKVFFGTTEAILVTYIDAGRIDATTPGGSPGLEDVIVENIRNVRGTLTDGFEYLAGPCPVSAPVTGLKVAREPDSRLRFAWDTLTDSCLAGYRVFTAIDPAAMPVFPADYTDITTQDEDGQPGSDASFLYTAPAGTLHFFRSAAEGTDGSVGP